MTLANHFYQRKESEIPERDPKQRRATPGSREAGTPVNVSEILELLRLFPVLLQEREAHIKELEDRVRDLEAQLAAIRDDPKVVIPQEVLEKLNLLRQQLS